MANEFSFDVVSEFDRQELVNALDQATRDFRTRYDLKDSGSDATLEGDTLRLKSNSEFVLEQVRNVLLEKAVRRNLSPKIFDFGKVEEAAKGTVRQSVALRRGLSQEQAKDFAKLLRDRFPKLRSQVQGDALRVFGKSKDELQAAMAALREREKDLPLPLQFTNYR
jgi:uncharacterized protein YajQ (UPF0234 family)